METACSLEDRLAGWNGVLQLDEFEVVHQAEDVTKKTLRFTVIPKVAAAVCPHWGGLCWVAHQTRDRGGIRDLPIGERAAAIVWHSDISNVSRLCGIPETMLERWYYNYVEHQQSQPALELKPITSVGVDELSQKKHRQFVAVIIDHTNNRVLDVLENREQATVTAYFQKARGDGLLAHVTEVTTDMWDACVNAARAAFGSEVSVVVDRFHVMKNLQERLLTARRELQRELPKDEALKLKGSRWLWAKNFEFLRQQQRSVDAPAVQKLTKRPPAMRHSE